MDLTKVRAYRINAHTGERLEEYGYNDREIELLQLPYLEMEIELKDVTYRINKTLDYSGQKAMDFYLKKSNPYDWEALENDIRKYGLLNPICVRRCNRTNPELGGKKSKYCIKDGNHRCKILYKLYPPNHKITVRLYGKNKLEDFGVTKKI